MAREVATPIQPQLFVDGASFLRESPVGPRPNELPETWRYALLGGLVGVLAVVRSALVGAAGARAGDWLAGLGGGSPPPVAGL